MIWFSIDSMLTPPLGLSAIAAAGIARAKPFKTMLTSFKLGKGLYILPFMFYYRPAILLEGSLGLIIETIASILVGLLAFAAFWENFLIKRTHLVERFLLLLAAAGLFYSGVLWNVIGFILFCAVVVSQRIALAK
ncbi:MAG: hypothetical protein JRJ85_05680 [Deltaproteobacteria bacterium]|nr:hypothetical protein [Deltaproteobacteria bacterium]